MLKTKITLAKTASREEKRQETWFSVLISVRSVQITQIPRIFMFIVRFALFQRANKCPCSYLDLVTQSNIEKQKKSPSEPLLSTVRKQR